MSEPDPSGGFRIGVVSGLVPREEHALGAAWAGPARIDRATFAEVMAAHAPELAIEVPDPHDRRGKPLRVDLRFSALRDFRPDALAKAVAHLRSLRSGGASPVASPALASAVANESSGSSLLDSLLDDAPAIAEAPARGDERAFLGLLEDVLHHPEVRRLESAWRGLKFLVDRVAEGTTIDVMAAPPDGVEAALAAVGVGDEPLGLVVVDHEICASPRDLARLEAWAEQSRRLGVPLVANASAEVLGLDDMEALARTQRRLRSSEDPRAVAVRALAARESARWVSLAGNRLLARPLYTTESARLDGLAFDEDQDLFIGAAWGVAVLASASQRRHGWPCALTGPRDGRLTDLCVRPASDRGEACTLPLEGLIREDVSAEAAGAGVGLLSCGPNRDVAFLSHAPVLFRGPIGPSGVSAAATSTLGEQLFVARLAQAVEQLAGAIPRDTDPAAVLEVARLMLVELFASAERSPVVAVTLSGGPPVLEVTVRPEGFLGLRLPEVTLGAALA